MNVLAFLKAHWADPAMPILVSKAVLGLLLLSFLIFFLLPGISHWLRLRGIRRQIKKFESKKFDLEFKKAFSKDQQLSHLWKEYQDSLHRQYEIVDGQKKAKATRATVPAEVYFNSQLVVDSRLHTEFFKHLPGLFTGIGIIGTFVGLIQGLRAFQVSENAATVRTSLESLMHSVGDAFFVSAVAICAAMLVTLVEKWLLTSLYRHTEEIAQAIDARFEAGAGEEYLARLVLASEDSASQSKILKDALVKDLGELLRELTHTQIAAAKEQQTHLADRLTDAARQDNQALGAVIADSIQKSLEAPLEAIAKTVQSASSDQSATAARMLQDVMASFSQRLNDLFGGQIAGLSNLNQKTALSIQEAVGALHTLVANLEDSSRRSTDAMAERMAQAIEKMEARQDTMKAQSAAFVDQIGQLVATSQSETSQHLKGTLESIGTQVAVMLASLNEAQTKVFEENRSREEKMTGRTEKTVNAMSGSVEKAMEKMSAASAQMAQSVATLSQTTSTSVDKMNAGANQLAAASKNFAIAGERVTTTMGQTATVAAKLTETSGALTTGATAIQELLRDYKAQRDAVSQMVTELRATVDSARREAKLTSDVLARIEKSAQLLGVAQTQADEYLAGVNSILGKVHTAFATEVKRTLDTVNTEFHKKLTTAVSMLSDSISELNTTLATAGNIKPGRG